MNQCHVGDVYDGGAMGATISIRLCGSYEWGAHSWGFRASDPNKEHATRAAASLYLRHIALHRPECSYFTTAGPEKA
jgi:hypothetical protein